MEKIVVINEKKYQEFKYEMKRENICLSQEDFFMISHLVSSVNMFFIIFIKFKRGLLHSLLLI